MRGGGKGQNMDDAFARRVRNGEPVVGAWSLSGHPVVSEVLAGQDFDFVVLDGEHSELTISDLANGVRAVEATGTGTAPVVRASGVDRAEIRRLLDLGPRGIVVPQIESLAEAREAVAATRYPPDGVRGVAGGRAADYGSTLESTVEGADEAVATILQVETVGAVDAIEDIAAIDGLDALFVGPADLSARLGDVGAFEGGAFRDAVDRVVRAAGDAGVALGTLATSPESVARRWEWGVDFLAVGTDVGYLRAGSREYLERFEAARR